MLFPYHTRSIFGNQSNQAFDSLGYHLTEETAEKQNSCNQIDNW